MLLFCVRGGVREAKVYVPLRRWTNPWFDLAKSSFPSKWNKLLRAIILITLILLRRRILELQNWKEACGSWSVVRIELPASGSEAKYFNHRAPPAVPHPDSRQMRLLGWHFTRQREMTSSLGPRQSIKEPSYFQHGLAGDVGAWRQKERWLSLVSVCSAEQGILPWKAQIHPLVFRAAAALSSSFPFSARKPGLTVINFRPRFH